MPGAPEIKHALALTFGGFFLLALKSTFFLYPLIITSCQSLSQCLNWSITFLFPIRSPSFVGAYLSTHSKTGFTEGSTRTGLFDCIGVSSFYGVSQRELVVDVVYSRALFDNISDMSEIPSMSDLTSPPFRKWSIEASVGSLCLYLPSKKSGFLNLFLQKYSNSFSVIIFFLSLIAL